MPSEAPKKDGDDFDLLLVHGETNDGEGARVLRARPGKFEAGEVRPLQQGRPLTPGGEVVSLTQRSGAPLYDVKVEYRVPDPPEPAGAPERPSAGPPQVATRAYRDSWERTFGRRREALN